MQSISATIVDHPRQGMNLAHVHLNGRKLGELTFTEGDTKFIMAVFESNPNSELCPESLKQHVHDYINDGQEPGFMLRSVLEGDLFKVVHMCRDSVHEIRHLVDYVYANVPGSMLGRFNVAAHIEKNG